MCLVATILAFSCEPKCSLEVSGPNIWASDQNTLLECPYILIQWGHVYVYGAGLGQDISLGDTPRIHMLS